jgi:glycosyltransferase involved in cell wall biosynthesis
LWNLALEGITSFSTVPLRSWTYIGVAIAAAAFLYGGFIVGRTVLFGNPVPGYASLLTVLLFMGGIELIGIGVVGEYVGRIYHESKGRPVYLVRRRYQTKNKVSKLPIERTQRAGRNVARTAQIVRLDPTRRRTVARVRTAAR